MLNQEQLTTLERKLDRFAAILQQKPGDELTILALAEASFRRGLKLEALTNYQLVIRDKPVPEAHLAVAEIYFQQNMANEAYGELRRLFELDPENVEARMLARSLKGRSGPPEDIARILDEPTSEEAFAEAKLRLQIQRAIQNRELQERTRNQTLEPGVVIHEYYMEEAKKKLIEVEDQLRRLEELREQNAALLLMPKASLVEPQREEEHTAEESGGETYSGEDSLSSSLDAGVENTPILQGAEEFERDQVGETEQFIQMVYPEEPSREAELGLEPTSLSEEEATQPPTSDLISPEVSEAFDDPQPLGTLAEVGPHAEQDWADSLDSQPTVEQAVEEQWDEAVLPADHQFTERIPSFDSDSMDQPEALQPGDELADFPAVAIAVAEGTRTGLAEPSFSIGFDLGVDNPLAPDLPDETFPGPPAIEMNSGPNSAEMSPSEPAIQYIDPDFLSPDDGLESPVSQDQGLSYTDDGSEHVGQGSLDEPLSPGVDSPEVPQFSSELVESSPPELPPVPEQDSADEESAGHEQVTVIEVGSHSAPESSTDMNALRRAYYESKAADIGKLTGTLARTRGVTSIYLVTRDGLMIDAVGEEISEERVSEIVRESFDFLLAYAKSPTYWVLECNGGIFVMQTLDELHVLIAVGQAGANFGALRFTMDKTKAKFETILTDVPR